jgi:hypothetical protein
MRATGRWQFVYISETDLKLHVLRTSEKTRKESLHVGSGWVEVDVFSAARGRVQASEAPTLSEPLKKDTAEGDFCTAMHLFR